MRFARRLITALPRSRLFRFAWDAPSASRIVLGGRFGEENETISFARLDRFVAAGGRMVDTAHAYAEGRAEIVIGRWIHRHPGQVDIVDKIGHPDQSGRLDLSPHSLRRQAEQSLLRLGLPTIDVLLLHRDDPAVPVGALVELLLGFVEDGFARVVGVSNWAGPRLQDAVRVAGGDGRDLVVSYQFSLAVPEGQLWPGSLHADATIVEIVRRFDLPLLGWAGQARGFFAGRTETVDGSLRHPFDTDDNRRRRERCRSLAETLGVPPEAVALSWSLHQPGVLPVVGPRTVAELNTSMRAAELRFDDDTLAWLASGSWS